MAAYSIVSCKPTIEANREIWSEDQYSAFTSLEYYEGYFYCAFRIAHSHCDKNGNDNGCIRVIRSKDGKKWLKYAVIEEPGFDLRDPQLSVTPNNQLMLLVQKVQYSSGTAIQRSSCVCCIQSKSTTLTLIPISIDNTTSNNWLWNVTWIGGIAHGFTYVPDFSYVYSNDGIHYTLEERQSLLQNQPTESDIDVTDGIFFCVVRQKGKSSFGKQIEGKWEWTVLPYSIACPQLLQYDGKTYLAARFYEDKKSYVGIAEISPHTGKLSNVIKLAEGLDCGYPGIVCRGNNLYVSYYNGDGVNSSIYLAKIKL